MILLLLLSLSGCCPCIASLEWRWVGRRRMWFCQSHLRTVSFVDPDLCWKTIFVCDVVMYSHIDLYVHFTC